MRQHFQAAAPLLAVFALAATAAPVALAEVLPWQVEFGDQPWEEEMARVLKEFWVACRDCKEMPLNKTIYLVRNARCVTYEAWQGQYGQLRMRDSVLNTVGMFKTDSNLSDMGYKQVKKARPQAQLIMRDVDLVLYSDLRRSEATARELFGEYQSANFPRVMMSGTSRKITSLKWKWDNILHIPGRRFGWAVKLALFLANLPQQRIVVVAQSIVLKKFAEVIKWPETFDPGTANIWRARLQLEPNSNTGYCFKPAAREDLVKVVDPDIELPSVGASCHSERGGGSLEEPPKGLADHRAALPGPGVAGLVIGSMLLGGVLALLLRAWVSSLLQRRAHFSQPWITPGVGAPAVEDTLVKDTPEPWVELVAQAAAC